LGRENRGRMENSCCRLQDRREMPHKMHPKGKPRELKNSKRGREAEMITASDDGGKGRT